MPATGDYARQSGSPPSDNWQTRYAAAARELNDAASVVARADEVAATERQTAPTAVCITGCERLATARRIGLFPGSFNPLTLAHLALVEAARRAAALDVVVWGIATATVDKERVARATLPDRLAQLVAYVRWRERDALSIFSHGLYVDEVRALRSLMPSDAELVILTGFDKIVQIFDPRYYTDRDVALRELFAEAAVLVAPRAGAGAAELRALLDQPQNRPYASFVSFVALPATYAEESSTEARRRAAAGALADDDLRDLLPPEGIALVRETRAYTPPPDVHATDPYVVRQAWIRLLQRLPRQALTGIPSLGFLVAASAGSSPRAAAVRALLARPLATLSDAEIVAALCRLQEG